MKKSELKELMKQAVKEVFQDEMKEILMEAIKRPSSTPIVESSHPSNAPFKGSGNENTFFKDFLNEDSPEHSEKISNDQKFQPSANIENSINGQLPPGDVSLEQITALMEGK